MSEDGERIDWRAGRTWEIQRRDDEKEGPTIEGLARLAEPLEVKVVDDVDASARHRKPVVWVDEALHERRSNFGIAFRSDNRYPESSQPLNDGRLDTGPTGRRVPGSQFGASPVVSGPDQDRGARPDAQVQGFSKVLEFHHT